MGDRKKQDGKRDGVEKATLGEGLKLKGAHRHNGVLYKAGTKLTDIKGLDSGAISYLHNNGLLSE